MNIYKEAAKVKGFYDSPLWDITTPFPEWGCLFVWSTSLFFGGDGKTTKQMLGSLIESRFVAIEQKIAYLQGILEEYSSISQNTLVFANSPGTVERTKEWFREVAQHYNSQKFRHIENQPKTLLSKELILDPIIKHTINYHIPIFHVLELCPKIVDYVKNYG